MDIVHQEAEFAGYLVHQQILHQDQRSVEIPTNAATKPTDSRRSVMTSLSTFSVVSLSGVVAGRLQWYRSSHDDCPRVNSACYFATVAYARADSANVSFT